MVLVRILMLQFGFKDKVLIKLLQILILLILILMLYNKYNFLVIVIFCNLFFLDLYSRQHFFFQRQRLCVFVSALPKDNIHEKFI
jgi:hypothetical protein